jgi:ABC-type uncharacterized transport system permease subunit
MERWLLVASTLLALLAAVWGMVSVHRGRRSPWTLWWMLVVFVLQLGFLSMRGRVREACPLADMGEILVFLSWSLTLFYLLVGPAYRISLLGVFTAPVVVLFQGVAMWPGVLDSVPGKVEGGNAWHEVHSAVSVLAYGGFALAAVAGVMFLVLDRQLKEHHLGSGLFRNLPPVRELLVSLRRFLWIGCVLLTIGMVAGFIMPRATGADAHLVAAVVVWLAYAALVAVLQVRGLTGRSLAWSALGFFVVSLGVFAWV